MEFHSFIVGQGIAGSTLALSFAEKGLSVKVFDSPASNTSSKVAAGIFNPITGKRQALTWNAVTFFPFLSQFYHRWQVEWGASLLHELPILRLFGSVSDVNTWSGKEFDEAWKPFVGKPSMLHLDSNKFISDYEALHVVGGGWLDVNLFMAHTRNYLEARGGYEERRIELPEIRYKDGHYYIGSDSAAHIIFCNGLAMDDTLSFTPMKGEILTISCPELGDDAIYIGGCFLTPQAGGLFKVGSTYEWRDVNLHPTQQGREEIEFKLRKFLKLPYQLVDHQVGIRPAVKDRKPLIGQLPGMPGAYAFNGMGSKGVSMAPFLAGLLIEHICDGKELPKEVDLNRFL